MYAIVVWIDENTSVPSVIGPYEHDDVFTDANRFRDQCHKVQVCNITNPEKSFFLTLAHTT